MLLSAGIVDVDKDCIGIVVAEICVGIVPCQEMHSATVVYHRLVLAPLEEPPCIVMQISKLTFRHKLRHVPRE